MPSPYEQFRRQGRAAFRKGLSRDANPYSSFEFTAWQSWLDGYDMAAASAATPTQEGHADA